LKFSIKFDVIKIKRFDVIKTKRLNLQLLDPQHALETSHGMSVAFLGHKFMKKDKCSTLFFLSGKCSTQDQNFRKIYLSPHMVASSSSCTSLLYNSILNLYGRDLPPISHTVGSPSSPLQMYNGRPNCEHFSFPNFFS
jgi:hypothetical protein